MSRVTLNGVSKVFGTETAVKDANLTVEDGEFVVIVGPSGCGKSTTLRMIAGLETVSEGTIEFDDEEVQELTPPARDVAMVFQNYALYPSMTARENIEYGLKHSTSLSAAERRERVDEAVEMLDIEAVLDHAPSELSGGQRQRVALGRAIVREPNVFLLDEPLSNLDAKLRSRMRHELQRIHQEIGVTTIYVTHDQKEAMTMGDRLVVLRDGRIQQVGQVEDIYNRPSNRFVGEFIGTPAMNTFEASVSHTGDAIALRRGDTRVCTVDAGELDEETDRVIVGLRPEHMIVSEDGSGDTQGEVEVSEYQGKSNFIHLQIEDLSLTARTAPTIIPSFGDKVSVSIDADDVYLFDRETGETLKTRYAEELGTVGLQGQQATTTEGV